MKVVWLDVETTGTNPEIHDIVQIAMLIEIDGRTVEEFNAICQPHRWDTIEPSALAVNGLTIEQLKEFPDPKTVYGQIVEMLGKYVDKYNPRDKFTLAGQKVGFDADFLKAFFAKCGDVYYGSWFNWRHIDLLSFVRLLRYAGRMNLENDKLHTICESLKIEPLKRHDAVDDIHVTRAVLIELMDRHLQKSI